MSTAALMVGLLSFACLGRFSRFVADDYCTYGTLLEMGFLESQRYWYMSWSGRYTFTFMINLAQLLGTSLAPWLPAALLTLWLGALVVLLRRLLGGSLQPGMRWQALTIGALVLLTTVSAAPDIYQSVLWSTGLLTYAAPLVVGTAYTAWLIRAADRGNPGAQGLAISLAIALFAGGFSEVYVSMQSAGLAMLAIWCSIGAAAADRKDLRRLAVAGLVGSLIAMLIIALSPGSAVRQALVPPPGSLLLMARRTVQFSLTFMAKSALNSPIQMLVGALLPFLLGLLVDAQGTPRAEPKTNARWLLGLPFACLALIVAGIAPAAYATSAYPVARSLLPEQYALSLLIALWSYRLGLWLAPRLWRSVYPLPALGAMMLLLSFALAVSSIRIVAVWLPEASSFAEQWDRRDALLRQAAADGLPELSVASLPHIAGLAEVDSDPGSWINGCIADSYGLERLHAKGVDG